MPELAPAEFAKLANISARHVSTYASRGKIKRLENNKIETRDPLNILFLETRGVVIDPKTGQIVASENQNIEKIATQSQNKAQNRAKKTEKVRKNTTMTTKGEDKSGTVYEIAEELNKQKLEGIKIKNEIEKQKLQREKDSWMRTEEAAAQFGIFALIMGESYNKKCTRRITKICDMEDLPKQSAIVYKKNIHEDVNEFYLEYKKFMNEKVGINEEELIDMHIKCLTQIFGKDVKVR